MRQNYPLIIITTNTTYYYYCLLTIQTFKKKNLQVKKINNYFYLQTLNSLISVRFNDSRNKNISYTKERLKYTSTFKENIIIYSRLHS